MASNAVTATVSICTCPNGHWIEILVNNILLFSPWVSGWLDLSAINGPAGSVSLGSLLQMHVPGLYPRPVESQALGLGAGNMWLAKILMLENLWTLLNRGSNPGARKQRKEGWERTEDEHLEPPPAGLTLTASGSLPRPRRKQSLGQGFRMWLPRLWPSAPGLREERHHQNCPQPLSVSLACWILKRTRHLIFHACRHIRSNQLQLLN